MSKFLYPIYKLNIESYKKWWLYHKKAGGSGILSEILQGFSFNLENTLNRKFKLFEIEGNSVQDGSPSPDNEVPILSSGDNGSINEKITNSDGTEEQDYSIFVQQPFRSIGDVRDVFFKNTVDSPYYDENLTLNGWYERHYIGEVIFDGSEDEGWRFNATSTTPSNRTVIITNNNLNSKYNVNADYLSNMFIKNSTSSNKFVLSAGLYLSLDDTLTGITSNDDNNVRLTKMLTYLSTHNVVVQYELETPLDLPCTEEQIQQIVNKPSTYKDFTIIYSQDETPAYLKIQYYKEG